MIQTDAIITNIQLPTLPLFKKGKVRSLYDFGDKLLIVASDRVSAFDYILPNGIPNKGSVLTTISEFWFKHTQNIVKNHLISTDIRQFPEETTPYHHLLKNRSMLVKKTDLINIECVVRGYIVGSGWKEYQQSGTICNTALPQGLKQADKLSEPIFTPATKAEIGDHDENISIAKMKEAIGVDLSNQLIDISMKLYTYGRDYAEKRGIILADTKFEFGLLNNEIILIDEVLTPDSSRFWPKSEYKPGISPPSFDKQIIRDHLETSNWDKTPPVPNLPEAIIQKAASKYLEVQTLLMAR